MHGELLGIHIPELQISFSAEEKPRWLAKVPWGHDSAIKMNAPDLYVNQVLLQDRGKLAVSPLVHLVSFGIWADTKLKKPPLL